MTYRVLGDGSAADLGPGNRLDLPDLCPGAEPAGRAVPDDPVRVSRRAARRRCQARADPPRPPRRRPVRPDRPPAAGPCLPGGHLVRLDDRAQGPAPRAAAVPSRRRARGLRPPPVHAGRAAGPLPGPANSRHAPRASVPGDGPRVQQQAWTFPGSSRIAGRSTSSRTG